jgi:hypothetical protein
MYIDKADKTKGMGLYCGKLLRFTCLLATQNFHQNIKAWRPLRCVVDLETNSSAMKAKALGSKGAHSWSVQNYHKMLAKHLKGFIKCQQDGGFNVYIRMCDEI